MPEHPIHLMLYVSTAAWELSACELNAILDVSRANNRRHNVTGLLVHLDRGFLQVLEGPRHAVQHLYQRIARDDRHTGPRILVEREIPARLFDGWTMGYDRWNEGAARTAGLFAVTRQAIEQAIPPEQAADLAILLRNFYAVNAGTCAA